MRRREFITLVGGAAAAWPLMARAQQLAMPVVGFFNGQTASEFAYLAAAFRRGLGQTGFVEGQNVTTEYRWAEGNEKPTPALLADLVRLQVAVLVISGSGQGILAAKTATTTIPIVVVTGSDPVKVGIVASLNRPGGNVTGVSVFTTTLEAKRLDLLHQLVPKAAVIGVLFDPTFSGADIQLLEIQSAARARGYDIRILNVSTESEMEAAFSTLSEASIGAVAAVGNPFFNSKRNQLVALAGRHAIPAIFELREFANLGGLMSYGPIITDVYRQVGIYTGRILEGEKPGDLPVVLPTKFEMVLNLKTAKALGIEISPTLLATADEVIE